MPTGRFELLWQRVWIAVEFVDDLHPLLILLLAYFLSAQARYRPLSDRYATLASQVACLALLIYLGFHYVTDNLDDAWAVAVHFGRGVLLFQILLALLTLFHRELITPFHWLSWIKRALLRSLPALATRFHKWAGGLCPPPALPPAPPPLTDAELRERIADRYDETYQHKLKVIGRTRLSRLEQRAIREQAKRQYLRELRRLVDE